jgi:acyl-coenzyme A synthetase/AMP-(fatty) acid ligase
LKTQDTGSLVSAGREETLPELAGLFDGWTRSAGAAPGARLAVISADRRILTAAAVGLRERGDDGAVIAADAASPEVRAALTEQGFARLEIGPEGVLLSFERSAHPVPAAPGRITLFTSGTTGTPKAVSHTWDSLRTFRAGTSMPERRWLLTYLPGTYAWFQMLTLWMFVPGQTLVVPAGSAPEEIWDEGSDLGLDAVSATPSFWRYLLAMRPAEALRRVSLAQVTLGGEPVRQDHQARLHSLFPTARHTSMPPPRWEPPW